MRFYAPFVTTFKAVQEVADKLPINEMENELMNHINLRNYGTGVEGVALIFIAIPPEKNIHEEYCKYRRKHKEVLIEKELPYHLVEPLSSEEILPIMAETYLNALPELEKLKIPDFDLQRFRHDVEQLFENQGWLVHQAA